MLKLDKTHMKIQRENLKNSQVKLKIEIGPEKLVKYFRSAYEKIAADVSVSGFRPGKAPYKIIVARVGYNKLLSEGMDRAVSESYAEALALEKIIPISQPTISVKKMPQFSLDQNDIKDDLIFEAELYIMPSVELSDYKKVSVKAPKKEETRDRDVEKILEHLLKQKATFKEINRPVKKGDRIEINFEGSISKVKKDKLCSKNFPLILGESNLVPGFEEKLIGLKKDDRIEFQLTFPNDYFDKEIASKKVDFVANIIDAKEVILPEMTDQFAKNFGQETVDKLKKAVKESLKKEIEQKFQAELEQAVIEKVLPKLKVELPNVLVENEISRMIDDMREKVESRGLKFEKYLDSLKKTQDDLKRDMRTQAEKNIRVGFLLGKIIEDQKIDQSNKEAAKLAIDYLVKTVTK